MDASWKFVVEAMSVVDGRMIKGLKPDAQGYYHDIPLMGLGMCARSGIYYNPKPIIDAIRLPKSTFNMKLTDGNLFGCINHPPTFKKEDIPLMLEIDQKEVSHHFKKIYSGDLGNDTGLILGCLRPWGPYGQYLETSLQDEHVNTSFSVRSLCKQYMEPNTRRMCRDVEILVTFDWVNAPGYKEASKRYVPAMESYTIDIIPEEFIAAVEICGCESIKDIDLMRVFGMSQIEIGEIRGEYRAGRKSFIGTDGDRHSLVHALLGC